MTLKTSLPLLRRHPLRRSRFAARLRRLEAQTQGTDDLPGSGLAALLVYVERHHLRPPPITDLTDAKLAAKIVNLTVQVAAGARGFMPLLLESLQEERARRLTTLAQELPV